MKKQLTKEDNLELELKKDKEFFENENKKYESFLVENVKTALIAKGKLHSKEIESLKETNKEAFAVELVLICWDIQFFIEEKDLLRLKEFGIPSQITKAFIHTNAIGELIQEVYLPNDNQKKFVLFLNPNKIREIIGLNSMCIIINVIFRSLFLTEIIEKDAYDNHFTRYIKAINRRKTISAESALEKLDNIDSDDINSKRNQKYFDKLIYDYYGFDYKKLIKLTEGHTEKIILSQLISQDNYTIICPEGLEISERDFIKRLLPLFKLVLPDTIKTQEQYDDLSEKRSSNKLKEKNSGGYTMDLDGHNYANIKSKLGVSWSFQNDIVS